STGFARPPRSGPSRLQRSPPCQPVPPTCISWLTPSLCFSRSTLLRLGEHVAQPDPVRESRRTRGAHVRVPDAIDTCALYQKSGRETRIPVDNIPVDIPEFCSCRGNRDLVKAVLAHGANPNTPLSKGHTDQKVQRRFRAECAMGRDDAVLAGGPI